MKHILLSLLILNLVGCQLAVEKGEQAPAYMAVTVGSEVVLVQDLTIPANQTSVYIQDGKITTYSGRDQYYPNCKFELYSISDQSRRVKADTFKVTSVKQDTDYAARISPTYAGRVGYVPANPTAIIYSVRFGLQSKQQPDVFRMTCEHWADPLAGTDLTLAEVRQTLGPLLQLKLK